MKRAAIATAAWLLAAGLASTAFASTTDPRKCSTVTPGGPTKHAYYCAQNAAKDSARTTMAAKQHVARWYPGVYCDQNVTLLKWKCVTFQGGDHWALSIVWRATSAGWKRTVTVVKTA